MLCKTGGPFGAGTAPKMTTLSVSGTFDQAINRPCPLLSFAVGPGHMRVLRRYYQVGLCF